MFVFSCGATPSRTVPKTQPLQVAFSLLERVDSRSQKEGSLGKKITWGRVGWTGQENERRMRRKRLKRCANLCATPLIMNLSKDRAAPTNLNHEDSKRSGTPTDPAHHMTRLKLLCATKPLDYLHTDIHVLILRLSFLSIVPSI